MTAFRITLSRLISVIIFLPKRFFKTFLASLPSFIFGAVFALGVVGFLSTQNGSFGSTSGSSQSQSTYSLLDAFGEVFQRIRRDYVREVDDEALIEAAIEGMVSSLDPHSAYLNPRRYRDLQVNTHGEFGGLGIEVTLDEESGAVKVISPLDDTPASKAGIKSGDLIVRIGDTAVRGLTLDKAVDILRGPVGKSVRLTILRGKAKSFELTLTRQLIKLRVVRARLEGTAKQGIVGFVRLAGFSENVASTIKKEIKKLKKESTAPIVGYVLDLRNNPGGLLDQAIAVSDLFLSGGEIVSVRGRGGKDHQRFQASKEDVTDGKPIVVLINGASASASEIVAGALKDHNRAKLLGEKSFGKGSVQTLISLNNRRGAALKLTVQHYYTPSGALIHGKGIEPDILLAPLTMEEVEGEEGEDGNAKDAEGDGTAQKQDSQEQGKQEVEDVQLQRALEVVRSESASL